MLTLPRLQSTIIDSANPDDDLEFFLAAGRYTSHECAMILNHQAGLDAAAVSLGEKTVPSALLLDRKHRSIDFRDIYREGFEYLQELCKRIYSKRIKFAIAPNTHALASAVVVDTPARTIYSLKPQGIRLSPRIYQTEDLKSVTPEWDNQLKQFVDLHS